MNSEMRDNIKIGLLAVIAVTMIIGTFGSGDDSSDRRRSQRAAATPPPSSNAIANQAGPDISNQLNANNPLDPSSLQPASPPVPTGPPTSIAFGEKNHSFGNIDQDTENTHVFKFTNTGENPLIIQNAKGSCGCTVPNYPREPIAPGEEGEIEVVYKPSKQKGAQEKTVTIMANTDPVETKLVISAVVEEIAATE